MHMYCMYCSARFGRPVTMFYIMHIMSPRLQAKLSISSISQDCTKLHIRCIIDNTSIEV